MSLLLVYHCDFKYICDQLHSIDKSILNPNKFFELFEGLDNSY